MNLKTDFMYLHKLKACFRSYVNPSYVNVIKDGLHIPKRRLTGSPAAKR
jgi:hypothetical protein